MNNKYVIIVGLSDLGVILLKELYFNNHDVEMIAIEKSYAKVKQMNDYIKSKDPESVDLCIIGDATEQNTLKRSGLKRCTTLILTAGEDATNLAICQTTKHLLDTSSGDKGENDLKIISVVRDNENKKLFKILGVDSCIGISDEILNIVSRITRPSIPIKILDVSGTDNGLYTIKIPSKARICGKKISEMRIPFKVLILGKIDFRGNCELVNSNTQVNEGDLLILNTSKRHQNLLPRYFSEGFITDE